VPAPKSPEPGGMRRGVEGLAQVPHHAQHRPCQDMSLPGICTGSFKEVAPPTVPQRGRPFARPDDAGE
jgi:hypothetical protein